MKHFNLTVFCLVLTAQASWSQLTITPRAGIETARTRVRINDGSFMRPLSNQFAAQVSIRFDYLVKNGHGVFAGVSTSNTGVEYNFNNPKEDINNYSSSRSNTQLRIEGGYQFSSKFSGCSSFCKSKPKSKSANPGTKPKNEMLSLRFIEQFGLAYIPSVKNNFENNTGRVKGNYTYNAGNWNLAFLIAWGFEISKGNTKKFNIGVQYLKGLGNLGSKTFIEPGPNTTKSDFLSRVSAWNLSFGIPISVCAGK